MQIHSRNYSRLFDAHPLPLNGALFQLLRSWSSRVSGVCVCVCFRTVVVLDFFSNFISRYMPVKKAFLGIWWHILSFSYQKLQARGGHFQRSLLILNWWFSSVSPYITHRFFSSRSDFTLRTCSCALTMLQWHCSPCNNRLSEKRSCVQSLYLFQSHQSIGFPS